MIKAQLPTAGRPAGGTASDGKAPQPDGDLAGAGLQAQRGKDHRITHRRGLSIKSYPRDCPPLSVQWFFAVDIPKRKPKLLGGAPSGKEEVKVIPPKKYSPFSQHDSKSIEAAFQKLVEYEESKSRSATEKPPPPAKVPVNEDFLFDVDIEERELEPAYWLGPVYEVRRGSWFQQEGSSQKPCDENLANQLEEGFLKIAPWRLPPLRSASQNRATSKPPRPRSIAEASRMAATAPGSPTRATASEEAKGEGERRARQDSDPTSPSSTYRLFGPYSNSIVTYQDATTAYVVTDDFYTRMSGTVYQRFAGGSHFAGMKVTRGYQDPNKKESKDVKIDSPDKPDAKDSKTESDVALKLDVDDPVTAETPSKSTIFSPASEQKRRTLERHMSSLTVPQNEAEQEEEVRRRDEREIQDDYNDQEGDEQNRPIEHLLLVSHGIGQRLGAKLETVNFVHDVNSLRKTLKAVYAQSPDLQALNAEMDSLPKNCRVQVLPINWRHRLDFPKTSLRHNMKNKDVYLGVETDEAPYPSLDQISIEGVPAVRGLITDLALDILLYQSPIYLDHITRIVVEECNRIYKLFCERNGGSKPRVSLVGHSLGSALMFDILCRQKHGSDGADGHRRSDDSLQLQFDVEDFYALGSPIGLFQILQGRTIASRSPLADSSSRAQDPFGDPLGGAEARDLDAHVSMPNCKQIFNIFHPADPISYRLEPLIAPPMSELKPQALPYVKRSIFSVPVGQGLSGLGSRVGQSVSGLWTSFSSGIASSLLNRSLGFTAEDESKMRAQAASTRSNAPLSHTNSLAGEGGVGKDGKRQMAAAGDRGLADMTLKDGEEGDHPPTLIDGELETLYAGFERRRKSAHVEGGRDAASEADEEEAEQRARTIKREEAKVRALNLNGRVDYSIQEGAFDISLIAAVASHLSYWADEDVSHFVISQLLSRHRVMQRRKSR